MATETASKPSLDPLETQIGGEVLTSGAPIALEEHPTSLNLNTLQSELQAAVAALAPELRGAQDFARLALAPESLAAVQAAAAADDRRRALLGQASEALGALATDGYPEVRIRPVMAAVHADLSDNLKALAAALARFEPEPAEVAGEAPEAPPAGAED